MNDTYENRAQRILDIIELKTPDKIPIIGSIGTWAIGYSNSTVHEVSYDYEKEVEVYLKPYEKIYVDGVLSNGFPFDQKAFDIIGSKTRFTSADGQTIQHNPLVAMSEEEYPELIQDPIGFTYNTVLPRKATKMQSYPENYEAVKEYIAHWGQKFAAWGQISERLKNEFNIPILTSNLCYPALDYLFDYYRGFEGISVDMRRRPEILLQAVEALQPLVEANMGIAPHTESLPPLPMYATYMHFPTFMSPKQFEKFFWPGYKKMADILHGLGGKLFIFLEGEWANKYEYIKSLPKGLAICLLEGDDIFEAKRVIGDHVAIAGGMSLQQLKYLSKEECLNHAKKLVDVCGSGGGYAFSTNRELISKNDINVDNLIAVHNYIHNAK